MDCFGSHALGYVWDYINLRAAFARVVILRRMPNTPNFASAIEAIRELVGYEAEVERLEAKLSDVKSSLADAQSKIKASGLTKADQDAIRGLIDKGTKGKRAPPPAPLRTTYSSSCCRLGDPAELAPPHIISVNA